MVNESMEGLGKNVPYDLRQIYAVELLGEHLKDVARARKSDNYSGYFKCLKDVYIISHHKYKKKIEAETNYNLLLSKIVTLANLYPSVWLGVTKDPLACAAIEEVLNNLEMFLYEQIEEAKLLGSSKDIPYL